MIEKSNAERRLEAENQALRARLEAAEETLRAIRTNEVDALVVEQGGAERVYTLHGTDGAYRTFVEAMCQGAATVSAQGIILYCNQHFCHLLCAKPEQVVGTSFYDFVASSDEGIMRAFLWEGSSASCAPKRFSLVARDGTAIPTLITAGPAAADDVACVNLIMTDLTDHEARVAAEAESRAKDRFLAVLSHELRTPLSPVLMSICALEMDSRLPDDVRENLSVSRRNLELETRLIDDLLDLSRIRNGKLRLQRRAVEMQPLVESVLTMVKSDIRRKSLDVQCDWNAKSDMIDGDPARLQQVVWNVIKNAIKFSRENDRINVRLLNDESRNLRLEVRDNGVGIAPNLLPRMFNAFEQGECESQQHTEGLGLGLAIARAIVEMHGGVIGAESEGPGRGATVSISLPLASDQAPVQKKTRPGEGQSSAQVPLHVLLVEDNRDTAMVLGRLLRSVGYTVSIAGSVASALEIAAAEPFDLIITDIGLPDGSGHDLMRQIREKYSFPGIALTGYGMDDDVSRSREFGFAEHIVKPVSLSQLQSVIARVAPRKKVHGEQNLA